MARETVNAASNLSLQQKLRKFIKWFSHPGRSRQELAVCSNARIAPKTEIGIFRNAGLCR